MVPALIIWLFKKYGKPFLNKHNILLSKIMAPVKRASVTILFMAIGTLAIAQGQTLNYNVLHKGNTVGHMKLEQYKDGDDIFLKIASDVKMRFLFSIQVNIEEDSHYRNGKLLSSHVLRMVNGKQKINKFTKVAGESYQLIDDGKISSINQKQISNNLTMM